MRKVACYHCAMELLRSDIRDGVAFGTFDDPASKVNKLSIALWEQIDRRLAEWESDDRIQAIVLASAKPKIWIAGADIAELQTVTDAAGARTMVDRAHVVLDRLARLRKPVVAAIQGATLGGGLEVALACQGIVVADAPTVQLGLPEVKLGLIPGAGGTQRFPRVAGIAAALRYVPTGDSFDAAEAVRLGVAARMVPPGELLAAATAYARELAGMDHVRPWEREGGALSLPANVDSLRAEAEAAIDPAHAMARARRTAIDTVLRGAAVATRDGMEIEKQAFTDLLVSPEAKQLIEAFFQR